MCSLYVGPAVGARGQLGFAEEGSWGCQEQTPVNFIEMNGETIISEIGSLVSNALRKDRAVHKRIGGVESAGGGSESEISPKGFETWFKHALGDIQTTRLDNAFVIECIDNSETSAKLAITHVNGVATVLDIVTAVGASLSIDLTNSSYDTIDEVMDEINASVNFAAYSAYDLQQGSLTTSIVTNDYLEGTTNSNCLEECSNIELMKEPSQRWVVGTEWNVYSHQIQGGEKLPAGMTLEAGRDIAAFIYSGSKINTMELTAVPTEFFMGSFEFMSKGGSTVSKPTAANGNTGNEKNAFKIRYTGTSTSADLTIDITNSTLTLQLDGTTEDIVHNINEPYVDPATGVVSNLQKIGGLVDYLDNLSYIDCQIAPYVTRSADSVDLQAQVDTSILSSDYVWINFESTNVVSLPVMWGDYIGSDKGDSVTFFVQVVTGGVPGVATLNFKKTAAGAYGNLVTTSATDTVFFPDNTALVAGDVWTFETIRPSSPATYPAIDPFSGFEGALSLDGVVAPIMGWSCNLNNNLYGEKYHLGYRTRGMLPEQKRSVEGSLNVEFDDLDLYRKFINGVSMNLQMVFLSSDYITNAALGNSATQYSLTIRQPNIEFNGTTPTASDENIILTDFPYIAMWDDVNNIPELRITVVSDTPYV